MQTVETLTAGEHTTTTGAGRSFREYGMDADMESEWLKKLDGEERIRKVEEQVGSYMLEVAMDQPVSNAYGYWFDDNDNIYSDPSLQQKYNLDSDDFFNPDERAGLPKTGTFRALRFARTNPGKMTLLFSPPGPASFDQSRPNDFNGINYDDGQLYMQYWDGNQIYATAVKVTDEGVLKQFFPPAYVDFALKQPDIRGKITHFLEHPVMTGIDIDDFLNAHYEDVPVYKSNKGRQYNLNEVMCDLRNTFAGIRKPEYKLDEETRSALLSGTFDASTIKRAYFAPILDYMQSQGMREISLAGSCGGSTVSIEQLTSAFNGYGDIGLLLPSFGSGGGGLYSSESRMMGWTSPVSNETKYKFDKEGECRACRKSHIKVGRLGPCLICKGCQVKFDEAGVN